MSNEICEHFFHQKSSFEFETSNIVRNSDLVSESKFLAAEDYFKAINSWEKIGSVFDGGGINDTGQEI